VKLSEHVAEHGRSFFQVVGERQLEGIVAKEIHSRYLAGRRADSWLKIKTQLRQKAVIGGFTQPKGSREGFGALILGVYEGADLVYIGHAGTGFSDSTLRDLRSRLQPLVQAHCPFKKRPKANAPAQWVRPELVCEVSFTEWTSEGILRTPVFQGLREDKPASEVRRSQGDGSGAASKKPNRNQFVERSTSSPTDRFASGITSFASATSPRCTGRTKGIPRAT
jgi:bifunctional non-homologous end joining protein LigD